MFKLLFSLLILAFLLTLKPKSDETAERKTKKTNFIKIYLNPILHLSPVWEDLFCQKSQYRCTLMCTVICKYCSTSHLQVVMKLF